MAIYIWHIGVRSYGSGHRDGLGAVGLTELLPLQSKSSLPKVDEIRVRGGLG